MHEYVIDLGPAIERYEANRQLYVDFINSRATSFMGNGLKEEIVRCRDCVHRETIYADNGAFKFCTAGCMRYVEDDDFCSWGEVRGGDC